VDRGEQEDTLIVLVTGADKF